MKKSFSMIIFTVSILIIAIIGFIDTKNNFLEYKFKQFTISTSVEKEKIENSLNKGYSLKMFLGYKRLVERLQNSDKSILHVSILDDNHKRVFELNELKTSFKNEILIQNTNNTHIYENKDYYIIHTKLNIKDTTNKGYLKTIIDKDILFKDLYESFYWLIFAFIIIFFIVLFYIFKTDKREKLSYYKLLRPFIFGQVLFVIFMLYLINTLLMDTLKTQNKAIVSNIATQISFAQSLGLPISKVKGIETTFKKMIQENESLSWINIKKENHYIYDIPKPDIFASEYEIKLQEDKTDEVIHIHALIPMNVIFERILNNVKNFLFLLFGSNLISYYLFTIVLVGTKENKTQHLWTNKLMVIKPLVFFMFLVDTFNISLLPEYFEQIALTNYIATSQIKYLFSIYFLFFVLSFIPATFLVKKYGTKTVFLMASLFGCIGTMTLVLSTDFYIIGVARIFSGLALGFTLIATENHLIESLPKNKRQIISATTGMLYSASIICGVVMGSLISSYFDMQFIFLLEFILAALMILYITVFISTEYITHKTDKTILSFKNKIKLLFDWNFIKAVFFAGFFSKVTMSAVIFIALPLILSRHGFTTSQIGQIIVFYSVGILIGGFLISKYTIEKTSLKPIMVGLILSGISLIGMSLLTYIQNDYFITTALIFTVCLLGVSHSIISSFLLPNIFNFNITKSIGITKVRPFVLICERGGNIFGPLIIMELLLLFDYGFISILLLGIIALVFAATYSFNFTSKKLEN